ncbi:MAG: hypothetical protein ABIU11_01855, partial [Chitinophagaceae bacterium]
MALCSEVGKFFNTDKRSGQSGRIGEKKEMLTKIDEVSLNEYGMPLIEVLYDGTIIDRREWTDLQKRLSYEGWKFVSDIL